MKFSRVTVFLDDFSLYLFTAPTVTDKSLASEGCSAAYVLAPVPHLGRAGCRLG